MSYQKSGRPGGRPLGPATPYLGKDIRLLTSMYRDQARTWRRVQRSILAQIGAYPTEDIPEKLVEKARAIDTFLKNATAGMLSVHEARNQVNEGMDIKLLEAQLRQELLLAARTFTADEWAVLDQVRAEQAEELRMRGMVLQ